MPQNRAAHPIKNKASTLRIRNLKYSDQNTPPYNSLWSLSLFNFTEHVNYKTPFDFCLQSIYYICYKSIKSNQYKSIHTYYYTSSIKLNWFDFVGTNFKSWFLKKDPIFDLGLCKSEWNHKKNQRKRGKIESWRFLNLVMACWDAPNGFSSVCLFVDCIALLD